MMGKKLLLRGKIINEIRFFFSNLKYLEVETPCRVPTPAPEANIDIVESGPLFLHTSPELCMKRLLADGYEKIFQICRCFRGNERGEKHLPEFTLLEWYWTGADYLQMMALTEAMIKKVAMGIGIKDLLIYQKDKVKLNSPWERLTVKKAFDKFASVSMEQAISKNLFDEILAFEIEPNLGREKPLFLFDYPEVFGSLARLKPGNNLFAERFELYISGLELCNGFSELTDHKEQRKRFEKEITLRKLSGKKKLPMPEKFLESLKKIPGAAGNALGIDRLVMLFTNAGKIDEVVAFTPEEL